MRLFFLEHCFDLALGSSVNPLRRPLFFPAREMLVLLVYRFKTLPLEGSALGMLDRVFNRAFAVGIANPRRVGDNAVMKKHGRIQAIELGLVNVRFDHALLEVVEHDVLRAAAKVPKRFLVQAAPNFLAGFPNNFSKTSPGVPQCHYEKAWPSVFACIWIQRQSPFAVIDLRFFAGKKIQTIKLFGVRAPEPANKPFDAVVLGVKPVAIDQILVNGHCVAFQPDLLFDPLPVGLAG